MTYLLASSNLEIKDILQALLKKNKINAAELARRVYLPQPTIQRIVSGVYKQPRLSTLQPIADYFQITLNQLRGLETITFLSNKKMIKSIPLLSNAQVNSWPIIENDNINQHVICDNNLGENSFAMYMPDNSMEPLIPKGSTLLVDPTKTPHHGSFIILKLHTNPEVIVRQLVADTRNRFIKHLNPELNQLKMNLLNDTDLIMGVIIEIRLTCEQY